LYRSCSLSLPFITCLPLLRFFEAAIDLCPVDYVPPRRKIVRAAVLVLKVVRVLPHIVAEDRIQTLLKGRILIRGRDDLQLSALLNQPAPSGTKLFRGCLVEELLESFEIAEVG